MTATETKTVTEMRTETVTDSEAITESVDSDVPPRTTRPTATAALQLQRSCLDPSDSYNDVNCTEIGEQDSNSTGDDPYGIDRDLDAVACESY